MFLRGWGRGNQIAYLPKAMFTELKSIDSPWDSAFPKRINCQIWTASNLWAEWLDVLRLIWSKPCLREEVWGTEQPSKPGMNPMSHSGGSHVCLKALEPCLKSVSDCFSGWGKSGQSKRERRNSLACWAVPLEENHSQCFAIPEIRSCARHWLMNGDSDSIQDNGYPGKY